MRVAFEERLKAVSYRKALPGQLLRLPSTGHTVSRPAYWMKIEHATPLSFTTPVC